MLGVLGVLGAAELVSAVVLVPSPGVCPRPTDWARRLLCAAGLRRQTHMHMHMHTAPAAAGALGENARSVAAGLRACVPACVPACLPADGGRAGAPA